VGYNVTGSTVQNCVSLGAKVTDSSLAKGRVVGMNFGNLTNNKARSDMKIGASGSEAIPTANIAGNAINGESVAVNTVQTTVFSGGIRRYGL